MAGALACAGEALAQTFAGRLLVAAGSVTAQRPQPDGSVRGVPLYGGGQGGCDMRLNGRLFGPAAARMGIE